MVGASPGPLTVEQVSQVSSALMIVAASRSSTKAGEAAADLTEARWSVRDSVGGGEASRAVRVGVAVVLITGSKQCKLHGGEPGTMLC